MLLLWVTGFLFGRTLVKKNPQRDCIYHPKQDVRGGIVVEVGPGIPLGNPENDLSEPWQKMDNSNTKYIPPQAHVGDYALYLNKASIEINVENVEYLIVSQSAILVLIRDDFSSIGE